MIKLQKVNAGYADNYLTDISFELEQKQVAILLGTNGAGKTCLLHTIAGVLKPKAGQIEGVHTQLDLRAIDLSYCYQSPLQNSLILVGDYLKLIHPLDKQRFAQLSKSFALETLLGKSIAKLSGGEKQRVKLVSCLAQKSNTILLDEPTTALDPYFIDQLVNSVSILKNNGISFLIATHDLSFAIKIGDRFLGLKEGEILFDSDLEDLKTHCQLDILFQKKFEWLESKQGSFVLC